MERAAWDIVHSSDNCFCKEGFISQSESTSEQEEVEEEMEDL